MLHVISAVHELDSNLDTSFLAHRHFHLLLQKSLDDFACLDFRNGFFVKPQCLHDT